VAGGRRREVAAQDVLADDGMNPVCAYDQVAFEHFSADEGDFALFGIDRGYL
jgi:hypothetical protein